MESLCPLLLQPARAPLLPSLCRDTEAELCSTEVALPGNRMVQIQLNNCSFCSYAEEMPVMPLVLVLKGLSEDGGGYNEVNKTFLLWDVGMDGNSLPPFSRRTPSRTLEGPTQQSEPSSHCICPCPVSPHLPSSPADKRLPHQLTSDL